MTRLSTPYDKDDTRTRVHCSGIEMVSYRRDPHPFLAYALVQLGSDTGEGDVADGSSLLFVMTICHPS
jgi:hypothetical protein